MEIAPEQFATIEHYLPRQRGNVSLRNPGFGQCDPFMWVNFELAPTLKGPGCVLRLSFFSFRRIDKNSHYHD
jgi:hypothetical protein